MKGAALKLKRIVTYGLLIFVLLYGLGRGYFFFTDGFAVCHILSDRPFDANLEVHSLDAKEKGHLKTILSQPFFYLGKGCQSYVFSSGDGKYVLKFFKYQRFRDRIWVQALRHIPAYDAYYKPRSDHKKKKLENLLLSTVTAFDHLQTETALVFVHLNPSHDLGCDLVFYDKMGIKRVLPADGVDFILQKRASMLTDTLNSLMFNGRLSDAKRILSSLVTMVVEEHKRGLADNDHALMQNTGVLPDGTPVHIDVGQIVQSRVVKQEMVSFQEIYNKMFKFRLWLEACHPKLLEHLNCELQSVMGDAFASLRYKPKKRGVTLTLVE